jgi:WD40 repeat protein
MRALVHKTTIYYPKVWGAHLKYFDISQDGQLIVVRVNDDLDDKGDNVFVYDTGGKIVDSFKSPHGGEEGVAFWPDKCHLLTPGCDPTGGERDGLKCQQLGNNDYDLPLSETPLSGIRINLLATSNSGRYVLGKACWPERTLCVDTYDHTVIPIENIYKAQFSPNDRFVAGNNGSVYIQIQLKGLVIALPSGEVIWRGKQPFLCFLPEGEHFVSQDDYYPNYAVVIWELPECKVVSRYPVDERLVVAAYSSDGKWFATGDDKGSICLRNTVDYTIETRFKSAHSTPIRHIKFSFDNTELVTVSKEEIMVWHCNFENGRGN